MLSSQNLTHGGSKEEDRDKSPSAKYTNPKLRSRHTISIAKVNAAAIMPSAISPIRPKSGITKFTNCRLLRGDTLVHEDLWISSFTGKIIRSQAAFYDEYTLPDKTIDLGGRIVCPGFIECQLNGAFGFNFSTVFEDMSLYGKKLRDLNRRLIKTGVTSYIPTVTSQTSDLYHKVSRAI